MPQKCVCPTTEYVQISDALPHKHWSNKCATRLPLLSVGSEDAITQEALPYSVKLRPLAKVCQFASQHGLDMFGVASDDDAATKEGDFSSVEARGFIVTERSVEVVEEVVVDLVVCCLEEEEDGCD